MKYQKNIIDAYIAIFHLMIYLILNTIDKQDLMSKLHFQRYLNVLYALLLHKFTIKTRKINTGKL